MTDNAPPTRCSVTDNAATCSVCGHEDDLNVSGVCADCWELSHGASDQALPSRDIYEEEPA